MDHANSGNGLFSLKGKAALVTGASYGLGVTFAEGLAEAGASVVLAARSLDKLRQVEEKIASSGGEAFSVACDVGDSAQVEAMALAAQHRFGRVDILVNNAGQVAEAGLLAENVPDELFEQTVRVNLLGLWYCCRHVGRVMLRDGRGGSIINLASIMGLGGTRDLAGAYQATKAAVINLTRHLACSWADRGVRVNALAPGWFPSEMTAGVLGNSHFRKWAENLSCMNRLGKPEELVGPLLFLASDASSFVTGQTLVVDGGVSAGIGISRWPAEFDQALAEMVPGELSKRVGAA